MVVAMWLSRDAIHVILPRWLASASCSLALAFLLEAPGSAIAQAPAVPPAPTYQEPRAISVAEIAVQADEVTAYLAEGAAAAPPSREIRAREATLPARAARLQRTRH